MEKIIIDKVSRIIKLKKKLEEKLNVKIISRGKEISLSGKPEDEYIAEKVIEALNFGFPFSSAVLIKEQGYVFEIIKIKEHTKRPDLKSVRARIIGKKGKTLAALSNLTKCEFELYDNQVGIIGDPEYIKNAQEAVRMIIQGSKQANVYSYLEKHQVKPILDLGLKETETRTSLGGNNKRV